MGETKAAHGRWSQDFAAVATSVVMERAVSDGPPPKKGPGLQNAIVVAGVGMTPATCVAGEMPWLTPLRQSAVVVKAQSAVTVTVNATASLDRTMARVGVMAHRQMHPLVVSVAAAATASEPALQLTPMACFVKGRRTLETGPPMATAVATGDTVVVVAMTPWR